MHSLRALTGLETMLKGLRSPGGSLRVSEGIKVAEVHVLYKMKKKNPSWIRYTRISVGISKVACGPYLKWRE